MIRLISLCVPIWVMLATIAGVWYSHMKIVGAWQKANVTNAKLAAAQLMGRVEFNKDEGEFDFGEIDPDTISEGSHFYACIYDDSEEMKVMWEREVEGVIGDPAPESRFAYAKTGVRIPVKELNERNSSFCDDSNVSANTEYTSTSPMEMIRRNYKFDDEEVGITLYDVAFFQRYGSRLIWVRTAIGEDVQRPISFGSRDHISVVSEYLPKLDLASMKNYVSSSGAALWLALMVVFLAFLSTKTIRPMLNTLGRVEKEIKKHYRYLFLMKGDAEKEKRDIKSMVQSLAYAAEESDKDISAIISWEIKAESDEPAHALSHMADFSESVDRAVVLIEKAQKAGVKIDFDINKCREDLYRHQKEYFEKMNAVSVSMAEPEQVKYRRGPTNCKFSFEEVISWYGAWGKGQGIKFNIESRCDRKLYLRVPPFVVENILKELVRNAHKHLEKSARNYGEDVIKLSADKELERCIISVENGGNPVTRDLNEELFAPGGERMGLRLVKLSVDKYGGKMNLNRGRGGRGLSIVIELPAAS